jgi:hypothetical protein
LTDAGVQEYTTRFGDAPIQEAVSINREEEQLEQAFADAGLQLPRAFIRPQTYPSEACWWWTRTVKTLIEVGNQYEGPFTYTVYDPVTDVLPEKFEERYSKGKNARSGSEPDLFVIMTPRGGTTVRVVIEFERAEYNPARMKQKVWKNLRDYTDFDGIYYIAANRAAAKKIRTAIKKVSSDAEQDTSSVAPGTVAVFRGACLENTWLPSPAQVDRYNETPPDKYPHMATAFYYYKHRRA